MHESENQQPIEQSTEVTTNINTSDNNASDNARTVKVIFQPSGRQGVVPEGMILLEAARRMGVEIESICGGHQTCRKCKVLVEEGEFAKFGVASSATHLTPAGERELRYASKYNFEPNARMSCACQLSDDLVVFVPEESQTRKQVVRKAAGVERIVNVDAAMRLYFVELPPAHLKDHRGDWERLRDELHAVHGLGNLTINLPAMRTLQPALAISGRSITVTVLNGQHIVRIQPGFHDNIYGIAVDVGTTTVAGHLCHLRTGEILASASRMNPQVSFGEDLMSRVSYSMMHEDGTERMHHSIITGLNELIADLCTQTDIQPTDIIEMVLVGNTTMHHLLLGVDPRELGGSPFSLVTHSALDVNAHDIGIKINAGANIHFPPCEAGHVGSDNVGVLIAEAPYNLPEQQLILDIGTNGEILLGNQQKILSASSPTGPAFEGAQILHGMRAADGAIERVRVDPATLAVTYKIIGKEEWIESKEIESAGDGEMDTTDSISESERRRAKRDAILNPELKAAGICGSGIIEIIAELFKAGVIAANGRFAEFEHPRLRLGLGDGGGKAEFVIAWAHETNRGQDIVVHSDDVRAIQLGKAALYAGTKLLMNRMELTTVDKVVLAGGFGSYISPLHAMILGLIPDCELNKVLPVGNAAGDGARMILLDKGKRQEAVERARWVTYIETAVEPAFQEEFIGALDFPHANDAFPHLAQLLDEARQQWTPEREAAVQMVSTARNQRTNREDRNARRAARTARRGE